MKILSYCTLYLFLGIFSFMLFSCSVSNRTNEALITKILEVQLQELPDSVNQLVLVYADHSGEAQASLIALESNNGKWKVAIGPVAAGIGENGFAAPGQKMEGDGKSPTGLFRLGQLFTYENEVDSKMPFMQSTSEDKWIDDPESADYNRHVRGETSAKSYENLKLASSAYKYCMVIEYNTDQVVKGKGSAIFFHLRNSETGTTAGCVAISESEMLQILKWLDPSKHPVILMGNANELIKPEAISAK